MNRRSIVYIDGFNFYYGLLRGPFKHCKWIDLERLFVALREADEV